MAWMSDSVRTPFIGSPAIGTTLAAAVFLPSFLDFASSSSSSSSGGSFLLSHSLASGFSLSFLDFFSSGSTSPSFFAARGCTLSGISPPFGEIAAVAAELKTRLGAPSAWRVALIASSNVPTSSASIGSAFSAQSRPARVAVISFASTLRFRATVSTKMPYSRSISSWTSPLARSESGSCGFPSTFLSRAKM